MKYEGEGSGKWLAEMVGGGSQEICGRVLRVSIIIGTTFTLPDVKYVIL